MLRSLSLLLAISPLIVDLVYAQLEVQWQLQVNHSGPTFYDKWIFYDGIDANTTGNVLFQTREDSRRQNLTYVNSRGNVVMKVDNITSGVGNPIFGRPSVKIYSEYTIDVGSLTVFDAVHVPWGCSVWPAFWTQGPLWPDDGEIDIVENVNLASANAYALHTLNGCRHPTAAESEGKETGHLMNPDCYNRTLGNMGCLVRETKPNSFGDGFAKNGGGAWATLWDDSGMKIWFWPRQNIPADVATTSPNPSSWGIPSANWPSTHCDFQKFFAPQTLIFDITLCGNFAGIKEVFSPSCGTGLCTDLIADPANFNHAYFEIRYLTVFKSVPIAPPAPSPEPVPTDQSTTSTAPDTQDSSFAFSAKAPENILSSVLVALVVLAIRLAV